VTIGIRVSTLSSKNPTAMLPGMVPSVTELASEETCAWLQPNSLIRGAKNIPVAIVPPKINARAANKFRDYRQACRSCLSIGVTPRVRIARRTIL